MNTPTSILQKYWGHSAFRPMQEEIIQCVLNGQDVLALLPTGGGKSICFQVPALLQNGLCLVISPLIALMKDQVENLQKRGIPATAIHSGMTHYEVEKTFENASSDAYKFLYLSPERLQTNVFKNYLECLNISLIAVDEAHCVSQWGYDFRPPYLQIPACRNELKNVPIIALTASATPLVQNDIVEKLTLRDATIFRQSFEKPNLSYSVFQVESKINKTIDILNAVQGSAIVYCRSRRETKNIVYLLTLQNIAADYYHAGLTQAERDKKQTEWIQNNTRVIVCTNAFGMGIDKPDVRTVIHYDMPDCLENYYQESGRAGRDGKKSYAILLYQPTDITQLQLLPDIRFPSIIEIQNAYQAIADYLQIPAHSGKEKYYDFDWDIFIKNFKLTTPLVTNVLKVLEQEAYIALDTNVFFPSRVQFCIDKDSLHHFEKTHPDLEPLIKKLLRNYAGIYDNKVAIFEKRLAGFNQSIETVKQQLQTLSKYGVIAYDPQKNTPQIYFFTDRVPAKELSINTKKYFQRKKEYEARITTIIAYTQLQTQCRSQFISNYFGDAAVRPCGICDSCLATKKTALSEIDFKTLHEAILAQFEKPIALSVLLKNTSAFQKEKVWETLLFLQAEHKIIIDTKTNEVRKK